MYNGIPFVPRNGQKLRVIHLGRVSTEHQNIENIDAAKEATVETVLKDYPGEFELIALGDQGSGWRVDRRAVQTAMDMIRSKEVDLVVMEDLSRAFRNPQWQYHFAHLCVDHKVRFIAPGDQLDTAAANWEMILSVIVTRHAMFVPDTRRRVNRTATHAFLRGQMVLKVPYGYRRVSDEEAVANSSGGRPYRIAKDPDATPVIREIVDRIIRGESLESVARWLNDAGVPTGSYVETEYWKGKNVSDLLHNPLLRGDRMFRRMTSQIIYATGEYRRERNPEPLVDRCPELAHLTAEEHSRVLAELERRNPPRGASKQSGRPRSDTTFPFQHLRCAICGSIMYRMSGRHLMCKAARRMGGVRPCWNRARVDLELVRTDFVARLAALVRETPALLTRLVDAALDQYQRRQRRLDHRVSQIESAIADLQRRRNNLLDLVEAGTQSAGLSDRLRQLEADMAARQRELAAARSTDDSEIVALSREEVIDRLEEVFLELSATSCEFATVLRREFPDLTMQPLVNVLTKRVIPRIRCPLSFCDGDGSPRVIEFYGTHPSQIDELVEQYLEWPDRSQSLDAILAVAGVDRHVVYKVKSRVRELLDAGHSQLYRPLETPPDDIPRWKRDNTGEADGQGASDGDRAQVGSES